MFARFDLGWFFFGTGPISQETCDRIEIGMKESEVEMLLGPPTKIEDGVWSWSGPSGMIIVGFDEGGKVTGKSFVRFSHRGPRFPR
jgi:hypothetical protein